MDNNMMNTSDVEVIFTYKEHELLNDVLVGAVDNLYALFPYGWRELPEDNELYIRYKELEDLQNKCANSWAQRFN